MTARKSIVHFGDSMRGPMVKLFRERQMELG